MLEEIKIAPSVLSADFTRLADELAEVATGDMLHFDVTSCAPPSRQRSFPSTFTS